MKKIIPFVSVLLMLSACGDKKTQTEEYCGRNIGLGCESDEKSTNNTVTEHPVAQALQISHIRTVPIEDDRTKDKGNKADNYGSDIHVLISYNLTNTFYLDQTTTLYNLLVLVRVKIGLLFGVS